MIRSTILPAHAHTTCTGETEFFPNISTANLERAESYLITAGTALTIKCDVLSGSGSHRMELDIIGNIVDGPQSLTSDLSYTFPVTDIYKVAHILNGNGFADITWCWNGNFELLDVALQTQGTSEAIINQHTPRPYQ